MPLFRDNPIRAGAIIAVMLFVGHYSTKLMSSLYAFHLTQTSVAVFAISLLIALVVMHHRRDAQFLTQAQEEMILISGMALFWVVMLVAWRALWGTGGGDSGVGKAVSSSLSGGGRGAYSDDWPCGKNDVYCVVEEYSYW